MAKRILRVFPRRTAATPDDDLARIGYPDLFPPECDEIHVSVTFTYDLPRAEKMAEAWRHVGVPVKIGGPATGMGGGYFEPGEYLKWGYVITSRGCPNRCWFCVVPEWEGVIRELPITDGWRVQDNNLLACSKEHIQGVFSMLSRQPKRAVFQGGLEAARMKPWIAASLALLRPQSIYFAYDSPSDKDALASAISMMRDVGYNWGHSISAYVLIGYHHDTFAAAGERLRFVLSLGVLPFAMLYRDEAGKVNQTWRRFQREWCRPTIVGAKMAEVRP
jgi:hypothetical protein